ncbi:AAA family ATPase [Microcoleus sp. FACHB-53]|nr:AAA family ATPase [Microcoleus sp. FACHB-53]
MQVEITIKNYRCFSDSKPAHIILRKGFTAFIGVNNSGKSSLLKFFYEFRSLFQLLSSPNNNNFIEALRGNPQSFNFASSVLDIEEVFNNTNNRNLEIQLRFVDIDLVIEDNAPPILEKIVVTIPRATNTYFAELFIKNKKMVIFPDGNEPNLYRLVLIKKDNIFLYYEDTPEVNLYPLFKASKDISEALYIGPFRNALELVTNTDYNSEQLIFGDYFDIKVGRAFIRNWRAFKSGRVKKNSDVAYGLTEDIRRIFGFKSLEINTSDDNRTLQLFINGKSYTLLELGSGLAQFILVLANAAIKQPCYILIDEPELNLHPSLQLDFLTTLGSYAGEGVLFATHNIGLARASAELIYSIRKDAEGESEVRKLEATPRLSEFLGELSFSGYRELGFDKILLVEGSTEVKLIQQFLRKYGKDHQIVLLPLGGTQLIKESSEAELEEIKRICENVSALIDSERTAPEAELEPRIAGFVETCNKVNIDCYVLERRAIENYFSDRAIKQVMGNKYKALEPYEALKKKAQNGWDKAENWRIAQEMTREELEGTDLGEFLKRLCD